MAYTTINKSGDYFNTKLYTGNGGTQSITGVGFQPDWVWIKNRTSAEGHGIFDAVRSVTKMLSSANSDAESTDANSLTAFGSDGFSVGSNLRVNQSSNNIVSWNWKANGTGSANTDGSINSTVSVNTTAGFSIVSYTGNATAGATIGHGLGSAPSMIIAKRRSAVENWAVYHKSMGASKYINLDTTTAEQSSTSRWNGTEPTSSVFSVNTHASVNGSGDTYIAYCFAEKTGYSKFGSYVGNNNNDGSFIYTGFAPSFVIIKNSQTARDWMMFDNRRTDGNPNLVNKYLIANGNDSEASNSTTGVDFLSNGFKCRNTFGSVNHAETYIYIAFAENPFTSSAGTPVMAR